MSNQLIQLFSQPIMITEKEHILNKKEKQFITNLKTNAGNTENLISKNTYILNDKELENLKTYIEEGINFYAHNILNIEKTIKFYITQSWANFYKKESKHHLHSHPNSVISGVYYVENDNCPIVFHRDNTHTKFLGGYDYNIKNYNTLNSEIFFINVPKNKLILFPSNLAHSVETNKSQKTRISLSFNTFFKGELGTEINLTKLKI
jgi:uncharacterized protein (TIGR02466 family)